MVQELISLFNAGQWEPLERKARAAVKAHPGQVFAWKALAKTLMKLERWQESLPAATRVTTLSPDDADAHNDLATVLGALDRPAEAEASYRRALALHPGFAQAHSNLGRLLTGLFRYEEAIAAFARSLELAPEAADTHNCLADALDGLGRQAEAEATYRRALALAPGHFGAALNLGALLRNTARLDEAQIWYRRALELQPGSVVAMVRLAGVLDLARGKDEEACALLERAMALDPDDMDAVCAMGNLLLRLEQKDKAMTLFRRVRDLRPLTTWRARKATAEFSAVFLDSPGPGSTPVHYLAGGTPYDCHFYCVLPDAAPDFAALRAKADVVVNMIADADNGADILPAVQRVVEGLDRPTINPPSRVMDTGRASMSRRLAGIPACRFPRTLLLPGPEILAAGENGRLEGFPLPALVRLAGTHGGDDFEKVDDPGAIRDFVSRHPEADHYLIEYVDYRSPDGLFRKYRMIFVDCELLPYHLAIHDDWKVHHFRTDMGNQAWMRQEEAHFLESPDQVFPGPVREALKAVAAATGLDYGGIDCALDREGNLLVFETNAAMLVHDETDPRFTYKNPYVARIKEAFGRMLARRARTGASLTRA
jgi:tetratricopeptide (TPR) repeat protein